MCNTYPEGRVDSECRQLQGNPDQTGEQLLLGRSKAREIVGHVHTRSEWWVGGCNREGVGVIVRGWA